MAVVGYSQTDREFWFAAPQISYAVTYPQIYDTTGIDRPIVLVISTSEGPAIVNISEPANPNFHVITDTLPNDSVHQLNLTAFIDEIECKPANTILNSGLLITSTKPINAVYEIQNRINSEGYTLKGYNALGNEFIIPAQDQYINYPYCDPPARNSISVVASEDGTTVKIVPTKPMEGQTGLDTIFIHLNRGQAWSGRALTGDTSSHLGGTFVFSDKPVAVTVTDDAVRPDGASGLSIDIAGDQLIPRTLVSNEYLAFTVVMGSGSTSTLYIYAFTDSTSVSVDGNELGVINRGERVKYEAFTYNPYYIQSNLPVEVYIFHKNNIMSSEVAGEIIPPLSCAGSYQVTFERTGPYGQVDSYDMNILCKTVDCGNFTCSVPYIQTILVPANFIPIPSTGNVWGFYGYDIGEPIPMTYSNSTGNFQISTINELRGGALRSNVYTNFSGLNLGPDRTLCPGDSILLDAGYGDYQYLWSTNATTRTITVTTPGTYWVQKTSASCVLSDTIVISNLTFTPVNLGADTSICTGDSMKLDAGPGKSWYHWNTGQSTQIIYVHDSGTYWVNVPVSPCSFTDSDTIHVSVLSQINLGPDRSICQGDSVLLDAGAGLSSYHWNTGALTRTIWAKSAGLYWVIGHLGTCSSSDSVNVAFKPRPSVNLGPDINLCQGDSAIFNAGYCMGCTYVWSDLTSQQFNIGNAQTYKTGIAGSYMVRVTDTSGCSNSDTIHLTIHPLNPVGITISSPGTQICTGTLVTFSATPTNGGTTPNYQWKVNGNVAGTDSSGYSYFPSNGDVVSCTLTSSDTCTSNNPATSAQISMTVLQNLSVGITISASNNPFCLGSPVTFTGAPTNGGPAQVFQWKVNGINAGTNSQYFTYNPANNDQVNCILTSFVNCRTNNPATSNTITMIQNISLVTGITISASSNPFCPGSPVTFSATPINGGPGPIYQWKVNGANAGTNSITFTYDPANNDSVSCVMHSNLGCVTGNPATSAKIIMSGTLAPVVTFTSCFDTITTVNAKPIKLKGGIPLGGNYSGPGVNSSTGVFDPSATGVGTHTIVYSYTNANNCAATAIRQIVTRDASHVTCGDPITDIRDNKVYPTVQIGSQCWMASNLNYGTILASSQDQRDNCVSEKYCFNDNPLNCINQGGLYEWDEVMQYDDTPADQGFCPPAWHIPTENDWNTLFANYTNNGFAGNPLKYSGYSGFDALLSGAYHFNSSWNFQGFATFFWSSTPQGSTKAWAHGMNISDPSVSAYPAFRVNSFSVRCVAD